uniref:Tetratricopeptide repeat domain 16 n=1 Tax=Electrophorus electricus TaxID=8005 RepID=A0A4W4HE75_ELEEL
MAFIAESYLQLCDFNSAALDYKHACYLKPQTRANFDRLAFIYYLQWLCTVLANRTILNHLTVDHLVCLSMLGRYSDCIRLVTNWLETDTPSPDLFTLRARLYHRLNQATMCYFDLKAALRLDPSCSQARALLEELEQAAEHSRQQAITKALEGELSDALAKMTTALEQNPEKAHYYIFRGTLYRRLNDFPAAIEDLALAVELGGEPERSVALEEDGRTQLALAYNDFAVHCFSWGFYSEAIMLLTRAICERRDESGLFINRGDCFYKQKEWHFALADYQQADDVSPVFYLVLRTSEGSEAYSCVTRLRKFQEAVERFSAAIEYEPGVAQYYRNRAKAHRRMHGVEEAKQDAISALILDPSSDEASPWPSVCERSAYSGTLEVLNSERTFAVCEKDTGYMSASVHNSQGYLRIWGHSGIIRSSGLNLLSPSPPRLSEKLEKMVLECDADGQLDTDCQSLLSGEEVEAGLEPHVFPQQLARSKEQVPAQDRQPLL